MKTANAAEISAATNAPAGGWACGRARRGLNDKTHWRWASVVGSAAALRSGSVPVVSPPPLHFPRTPTTDRSNKIQAIHSKDDPCGVKQVDFLLNLIASYSPATSCSADPTGGSAFAAVILFFNAA
jgi:hypothetical protein